MIFLGRSYIFIRSTPADIHPYLPYKELFEMAERPPTPDVPLQAAHLSLSCASCGDEVEEVQCLPCLHSLPLCDKAACQQKALLRGVTCPLCREVFPVPSGGFMPHPFAGRKAASQQCEEKEAFCHEDHDEPQKAVSYCPQCPGAICEDCVQVATQVEEDLQESRHHTIE